MKSKVLYFLRSHFDPMVFSVVRGLIPWLSGSSGKILEIGCGAQSYRHLIPTTCVYQGIDNEISKSIFHYVLPGVLYYSGDKFPISDHSFNYLFHTEVLEHVFDTSGFSDISIFPRGTDITVISHKIFVKIYGLLRRGSVRRLIGVTLLPLALIALAIDNITVRWKIGSCDDCLGYNVTAKKV